MVDSAKGITNFHSPSDVIVDASMPAMIRLGGKMYGADGRTKDTKAVNPESTFSRIYQEMINWCKTNGQFDPTTMGTVPNVGLMAQKAEEYGSHDKTFEIPEDGVADIVDIDTGEVLLSQNVEEGDIWRMPVIKDAAIRDWVKLAVTRARASGMTVVFWLDTERPHEAELRKKVKTYLEGPRHRGPAHPDHAAGVGHAVHAGAGDPRAGHHRRDRKHPARLPHRPVPDPGTGHQREDAVDRAVDGRRRNVRDRRRRFGAQARPSAGRGEPPAVGFARRVPRVGCLLRGPGRQDRQQAGHAAGQDAGRARSASCWTTTRVRRARPASSTTAAASSTSRMYWAQELAEQTEDKELADHFAALAKTLADERGCHRLRTHRGARAIRSTSAATTTRTARRPRR